MARKPTYNELLAQNKELKQRLSEKNDAPINTLNVEESEARYKSLFDTNLEIIYVHDFNGNLIDANLRAKKVFGYSGVNPKDFNFSHFIDEKQMAVALKQMELLLETGHQDNIVEYKVKTQSGDFVYLETNATLLYKNGIPYAIQTLARDITERKKAEEALLEYQSLIQGVIESTSDMIWTVDPIHFALLTFNKSTSDYVYQFRNIRIQKGFKLEDIFQSKEMIDDYYSFFRKALKEGPFKVEYKIYDRIVQLNFNVIKRGKNIYAISVFSKDITERTIINTLSLELTSVPPGINMYPVIGKRLRELTNAAVVTVGDYSAQTCEVVLHHIETDEIFIETASKMLGTHPVNLRIPLNKNTYHEIMHEGLVDKKSLCGMTNGIIPENIGNELQKILHLDKFFGVSFIVEGKLYGTANFILTDKQSLPSSDMLKSVCHIIALSLRRKDIEEKYFHALIELKESEEKFRQMAENTDEVFWLSKKDKILYINPAFENVWGYSCEEMYHNPDILRNSIHPDDQLLADEFLKLYDGENYFNSDLRIKKHNNQIRWINAKTFPIFDEKGQLSRKLHVARDISEKKQFEEELIQAKEKAEESDRLKSAFLANMSHEIRSPMNAIIGFAEMLTKPRLSEAKKERYSEIIKHRSYDLLRIIEDILDISKIEVGQMKVLILPTHLSSLFREVYDCNILKIKSINSPVELRMALPNNLQKIIVRTDSQLLKQVLNNLIENSIKFTMNGFIEFGCDQRKNMEYYFYVKDTGIGIPEDKLELIFDRFRQAEEAYATRVYGGTGLGLSIVKGIVTLLKGKIGVESTVDKGSLFYFTIPMSIVS